MLSRFPGSISEQLIFHGSRLLTVSSHTQGGGAWLSEQKSIAMNQSMPPSYPLMWSRRRRMLLLGAFHRTKPMLLCWEIGRQGVDDEKEK